MEDDEDDFFAYQTAKSLKNRRNQLNEYFQSRTSQPANLSSSDSDSESKSKSVKTTTTTTKPKEILVEKLQSTVKANEKDSIKNEIDAIVSSCFQSNRKETKRKIKLGKRTAADDREFDDEEEYLSQLTESKSHRNALNKSCLQDDEEKVTRETAAYDRLDAILRVTKPLCEKSNQFDEDQDEEHRENSRRISLKHFEEITLKIDHSDGKQLILSFPSNTTFKEFYDEVSRRLSSTSISLVYQNKTLKFDEISSKTLKEFGLTSNEIHLFESYQTCRKLRIFIQTKTKNRSNRREYQLMATDHFEKIFRPFQNEIQCRKVRFELDGDEIHPGETPEDYQMDDGEVLDAFLLE